MTNSMRPVRRLGAVVMGLAVFTSFAAAAEPGSPLPAESQKIVKLIEQLGDDDYYVRERAQAELIELGAESFDALTEAGQRVRDVEIAERIAYLMRTIRIRWVDKSDAEEVRNLLQNYEGMTDGDRRSVIVELAKMPGTTPLAALCRIVRYEPSQAVAKHAALAVLTQPEVAEKDWAARSAALRAGLGAGSRPSVEWLRAYLIEHDDPTAGAAKFAELIDEEERELRQFPHRTSADIVMSLLRRQADAYARLDRPEDMFAALVRLAALEEPRSDTTPVGMLQSRYPELEKVLTSLNERRDWQTSERVVERFADRIAEDPLLAYVVARSFQLQNDDKAAARYVQLAKDATGGDQRRHLLAGIEIRGRGYIEWAEDEYRLAASLSDPWQNEALYARTQLGESLHDRAEDLEAAKALDEAVRGLEQAAARNNGETNFSRSIETIRARAHYFNALHFKAEKDSKKSVEHLLKGLDEDQHDAEILIELFHVADLDVPTRDRVRKLIREAADIERRNIEQDPNNDTPYNQLAWLISNTEGDFQEALAASKKSLELEPGSAGHMDTLARCLYALGDYENAVKQQRAAIEKDPYSQQMQRQLKLFEAALEKQRRQEKK